MKSVPQAEDLSASSFMPYNSAAGQKTIERQWDTFNPIENPMSPFMPCNKPGTPTAETATVQAGSKVTAFWNQYSHDIGPLVVWMTECAGPCASWNGQGGKWFKIDESGLLGGTVGKGRWGSGEMIKGNLSWTVTIPSSLKAGEYLLRHETIAMHSTIPQFYPNCAQIKVTGGGSASPGANYRASIPGVYSSSGK
jgi:Auxiliary Activity family 9 (formerly GH61)